MRFEEGHCIDDEFFTYRTVLNASSIAITEDVLYHYRHRLSGAMRNTENQQQRFNDQISFVTERFEPILAIYPGLRKELTVHLVEVLFHVIRDGAEYRGVFQRARKDLKQFGLPIFFGKYEWALKKNVLSYSMHSRKWFVKNTPANNLLQEGCFP